MILVTGGCGFIGSNFILESIKNTSEPIVNLDKLTYAGNPENLCSLTEDRSYKFIRGDIGNEHLVSKILSSEKPRAIINFAAESHVDRSIADSTDFLLTNVLGTVKLLNASLEYWINLSEQARSEFRFIHISTDEVFGSLGIDEPSFSETHRFAPNSPYSASKAASDHFVRAFHKTHGLPCITTHCSNNYGPFQFPEKLIPLCITNALSNKGLPIYGDGLQVRDWLHVSDHCSAICKVLDDGKVGESYNIGGNNEISNIEVVSQICGILDSFVGKKDGESYSSQIVFVKDRAGHDRRYAVDASKIQRELGWKPAETFDSGLVKTVKWYLENPKWLQNITSGVYQDWINNQYSQKG